MNSRNPHCGWSLGSLLLLGCTLPQMYGDIQGAAGSNSDASKAHQGGKPANGTATGGTSAFSAPKGSQSELEYPAAGSRDSVAGASTTTTPIDTSLSIAGSEVRTGARGGFSGSGATSGFAGTTIHAVLGGATTTLSGGTGSTPTTAAPTGGTKGSAGSLAVGAAAGIAGGLAGASGGTLVVLGGTTALGSAGAATAGGMQQTSEIGKLNGGGVEETLVVTSLRDDAVWQRTYPASTYKEIAATETEIYLLDSRGSSEVRRRDNPDELLILAGTNFTALDAVSGWNMIATRDWEGSQGVFIDALGSANHAWGKYPTGVSFVSEVAAYEPVAAIRKLRICIIGRGQEGPERLQCGTHVPGATVVIAWDEETYPVSPTARGLAAMMENGVPYLLRQELSPNPRWVRFVAPNGALHFEELGSEEAHAYLNPDFPASSADALVPIAFDYVETLKSFYAIDDYFDVSSGTWRQTLVTLSREMVRF